MRNLTVDIQGADGGYTVVLAGELDFDGRLGLETELTPLVDRPGLRSLTLDLSGVRFMDSTGLGLILELQNRATVDGFDLALVPGPRDVQRVFEVTGLIDALPFRAPA